MIDNVGILSKALYRGAILDKKNQLTTIRRLASSRAAQAEARLGVMNRLAEAVGGKRRAQKKRSKSAVKHEQSLFVLGIIIVIKHSRALDEWSNCADEAAALASFEAAAVLIMEMPATLAAVEAVKQAYASVCSEDPAALGVDLPKLIEKMESLDLSEDEGSCKKLALEAMEVASGERARFSLDGAIAGVVADTLSVVLASNVLQVRFARRFSEKLEDLVMDPSDSPGRNALRM